MNTETVDSAIPPAAVDRIVIRRWRDDRRNPIALFMDQPETYLGRGGMVNSYQHVGQHGAADPAIVHETESAPENDPDAIALVRELRAIGYNPRVLRRFQRKG